MLVRDGLQSGALQCALSIVVPRAATQGDVMALTQQLEAELNRVCAQADEMVGHAPIEPGAATLDDTDAAA